MKFIFSLLITSVIIPNIFCQEINLKTTTDYSDEKNWSIISDTITHDIDVFFVHPTTYGPPSNGSYIADLNDETLNNNTDIYTIDRLTSAFSYSCNIFAPRYRQVNIEVLSMPDEMQLEYLTTPTQDILNALSYYLKNYNNGRPFILASHSQGSNILQKILLTYPELIDKEKLVAAYMPGWTFTDDIISEIGIPLSSSSNQLQCIIVWNTIGKGGHSPVLKEGARCNNPLSWTMDTHNYSESMNKGAKILTKDHEIIEIIGFTSAKINDQGGLEIPTPQKEILDKLNMSMGPDCYHSYDYDFFFNNIIENVNLRCNTYLDNMLKN